MHAVIYHPVQVTSVVVFHNLNNLVSDTKMCVNVTVYLSIRGENPKEHAVRQELVDITCEYFHLINWQKRYVYVLHSEH